MYYDLISIEVYVLRQVNEGIIIITRAIIHDPGLHRFEELKCRST